MTLVDRPLALAGVMRPAYAAFGEARSGDADYADGDGSEGHG